MDTGDFGNQIPEEAGRIYEKARDVFVENTVKKLLGRNKASTEVQLQPPQSPPQDNKRRLRPVAWLKRHMAIIDTICILLTGSVFYMLYQPAWITTGKGISLRYETDQSVFPLNSMLPDAYEQHHVFNLDSGMKMQAPHKWKNYQGWVTITVPIGRMFKVSLPDGTVVYLDSASSLRFFSPFGSKGRTIFLKGQAYFDVHPYLEQSLTVYAGNLVVTVTNASFSINSYDNNNDERVSLLTETVLVSVKEDPESRSPIILSHGNEAILSRQGGKLSIREFDTGRMLALYQAGRYLFSGAPFHEVFKAAEQWYGIPVTIIDPKMTWYPYTGYFDKKHPLNDFLEHLKVTDNVEYEYDDKGGVRVRFKE